MRPYVYRKETDGEQVMITAGLSGNRGRSYEEEEEKDRGREEDLAVFALSGSSWRSA